MYNFITDLFFASALMLLYFIQDSFRPFHSQYGCWSHGWQDGWNWSRAVGLSPSWLDHLQELVQTWGRLRHARTLCYGGSGCLLGYSTCWSLCMGNTTTWEPTKCLSGYCVCVRFHAGVSECNNVTGWSMGSFFKGSPQWFTREKATRVLYTCRQVNKRDMQSPVPTLCDLPIVHKWGK